MVSLKSTDCSVGSHFVASFRCFAIVRLVMTSYFCLLQRPNMLASSAPQFWRLQPSASYIRALFACTLARFWPQPAHLGDGHHALARTLVRPQSLCCGGAHCSCRSGFGSVVLGAFCRNHAAGRGALVLGTAPLLARLKASTCRRAESALCSQLGRRCVLAVCCFISGCPGESTTIVV